MSIKADCHLHSSFSGDSKAPMPEMIDKGITLGLETMCFTEHNDFDYPRTEEGPGSIFLLNTDSYLYDILRCRAKYEGKMRVLFGVELGLQPHLADQDEDFTSAYDFDFVIGSTHLCREWILTTRNFSRSFLPRRKPSVLILQRRWKI